MNEAKLKLADGRAQTAHGGKAVYGAAVCILLLDTKFPRLVGDIGNATWQFPVLYKVVRGVSPHDAMRGCAARTADAFMQAACEQVPLVNRIRLS